MNNFLFKNISVKIKISAIFLFYLEVFCSILFSIFIINSNTKDFICGLLFIILYFVIAWLSSIILYGFGELLDYVKKISEKQTANINYSTKPPLNKKMENKNK